MLWSQSYSAVFTEGRELRYDLVNQLLQFAVLDGAVSQLRWEGEQQLLVSFGEMHA